VTAGNGTASVAFTAPASNGGSAISTYTASCVTGTSAALTNTGAQSPIVVSGLTNGSAYDCSVKATNTIGTSAASATAQVTPVGPPPAPTIGTATAGDGQASIAFTAPTSNGGAAITSYTASCQTGTSAAVSATGSSSPITVTGLTNGSAYTCTVKATNSAGAGTASSSVSVTPRTVPGAPTIGAATPGSTTASIAFTAPTSTGGASISGYTVSCVGGGATVTATGSASPISVTGLTNSTTYSCTVKATNAAGSGAASGSVSVTPLASLAPVTTSGIWCPLSYSATNTSVNLLSQVSWSCTSTTRSMTSTQIPEYPTHSTFPGNGNNAMKVQSGVTQTFTLTPAKISTTTQKGNITGWAKNGVKLDPATAETCPTKTYCPGGGTGTYDTFNVEALGQTLFSAGVDGSNAHMQPDGAYHYHGMPLGYMAWISTGDTAGTPKVQYYLLGFAVDGFPVYAKYGYTNPTDATSALKEIKSSWRKRTSSELSALYPNRPSSVAIGTFTQDWVFDSTGSGGDLDDCNGRYGVTPDFPNGIYHYYITTGFPYIQRCLKGTVPAGGPTPPLANRGTIRRPPATLGKPPKRR